MSMRHCSLRGAAAVNAAIAIFVTPTRAARTCDLRSASMTDINAAFDAGALTAERLTGLYLARIAAYDKAGPRLNGILYLNPRAIEDARALDAERRVSGRRSPLHGIPTALRPDRAATMGQRLPPDSRRSRWERTPAARSADRRRRTTSWACGRRLG